MNPSSFPHTFISDVSLDARFTGSQQPNLVIENDQLRREIEVLKRDRHKIVELEGIISSLRQDNASLSNRCNDRFKEVAAWRSKCSSLEQTLSKVPFLTSENERLNDLLLEKTKEIESLKVRAVEAEKENSIGSGLKSQISQLMFENERIGNLFTEKVKELNALKLIVAQSSETDFKIQAIAQERDAIRSQYSEKVREVEALRVRLSELDRVNLIIEELKNRLYKLASENDRVNTILTEKTQEINLLNNQLVESNNNQSSLKAIIRERDMLRTRLSIMERQTSEVDELKFKISLLVFESERLNGLVDDKNKEIESLKQKELQSPLENIQISDLRFRLTQFEQDNQRLNTVIGEKERELQDFRFRSPENTDAENRMILLRVENERLSGTLIEKAHEIESLRLKAFEADSLSGQVRNLNDEKTRLNEIVIEKSRENDGLRNKNAAVSHFEARMDVTEKEMSMLKLAVEDRERVIGDLRLKVSDYEQGVNELKARIVLMTAENERLSNALNDKNREIDALKFKPAQFGSYANNDLRLQIVTAERDRLSAEVVEKTREIEDVRKRLVELEGANAIVTELRGKNSFLNFENERLGKLLAEKSKENEGFRLSLAYNTGNEQRLQGVLQERDSLNFRLNEKTGEVEQLKTRIADLERDLRAMEDLKIQLSVVKAENDRLKYSSPYQMNSYGSYGTYGSYGYKTESEKEMEQKCKTLLETNDRLNYIVTDKSKEIDSLKREISKLEKNFSTVPVSDLHSNYGFLNKDNEKLMSERKPDTQESPYKYTTQFGSPYTIAYESPRKYEGVKMNTYYETSATRDNSFLTRIGMF